jgi:hypothetical protein
MNKIVVVYRSKSGFTKKYAEWIAKAVNADLFEGGEIKIDDLLKYDTVVYGAALYASGINGIKFITDNFNKLKENGLHTALDTSGIGDLSETEQLLAYTDLIICDIKFTEEYKFKNTAVVNCGRYSIFWN